MYRADNLTTFMYRLSRNSGATTSWNPKGLSRPETGKLYFFFYDFVYFTPAAKINTVYVRIVI
jgi:hypothetical protein